MTTKKTLVTIVTPAFNCEKYIRSTYESILAQTLKDWEWRVVDDCSDDGTLAILEEIASYDARVVLTCLSRNMGAAVARNIAIKAALGRYIAFLDADDIWHPDKLERQCATMRATGAGLSYSAYDIIRGNGVLCGHVFVPDKTNYQAMLKRNVIGCLTAMYDTKIYGIVTMPPMRKRQDYGLWLELLRNGDNAVVVPGTLASYRRNSGSLSSNKISAAAGTWTVFRKVECLKLHQCIYYFSHYLIGSVVRRIIQRLAIKMQQKRSL